MARIRQSPDEKVLDYFKSTPFQSAKIMLSFCQMIIKDREKESGFSLASTTDKKQKARREADRNSHLNTPTAHATGNTD